MIVLDTNIISETMRRRPAPDVLAWLDRQAPIELFVTSILIGEIHFGLECLDEGRRKIDLQTRFQQFLERGFEGRILDYSAKCARHYGTLMVQRRSAGQPLSAPDAQIAAICLAHGASIATRNSRDFEQCGILVINPFEHYQGSGSSPG
ncbi:MAG: type II toxin-antitoxin system VapC family toxin [Wenzhouxiangellaceae bacterium]